MVTESRPSGVFLCLFLPPPAASSPLTSREPEPRVGQNAARSIEKQQFRCERAVQVSAEAVILPAAGSGRRWDREEDKKKEKKINQRCESFTISDREPAAKPKLTSSTPVLMGLLKKKVIQLLITPWKSNLITSTNLFHKKSITFYSLLSLKKKIK